LRQHAGQILALVGAAALAAREMTLTPLSNKRLVRDLVTEIAPPAERFVK